MCQWTGSSLVRVFGWRRKATSHYLYHEFHNLTLLWKRKFLNDILWQRICCIFRLTLPLWHSHIIFTINCSARWHYTDVMMTAMVSQITSLTIVYSTVYSGADKENIKAPRHWPLGMEITDDRWRQMASNAENVSIWWRHDEDCGLASNSSHCLNQWWPNLLTYIYVTLSRWLKTTRPTRVIDVHHQTWKLWR